ncbi:MAG: hypothetical protein Q9202_000359 [Teloschistes flavicans]
MADERYAISIAQLAIYVILFPLAAFVAFRHGFGKSSGWLYLIIFTAIRIASSALGIVSHQHPTNKDDLVWYSVLGSVGISPLLLAAYGLLSRVNESIPSPFRVRIIRFLHIPNLLALVLAIVGGTRLSSSDPSRQSQGRDFSKAGIIIFLILFIVSCAIVLLTLTEKSSIPQGERRLLFSVLAALPFIFVRILYSTMALFVNNSTFKLYGGNATVQLCMAVIEEIIVTIIFIAVGLTVSSVRDDRSRKAYPVGEEQGYPMRG